MRGLISSRRAKLSLLVLLAVALVVAWVYWNRPTHTDMASYAPADSLAFVEANDVTELAQGIEGDQAWKTLARPIGAPAGLLPNRWLIRLARWAGIGSAEAVLMARSPVAG